MKSCRGAPVLVALGPLLLLCADELDHGFVVHLRSKRDIIHHHHYHGYTEGKVTRRHIVYGPPLANRLRLALGTVQVTLGHSTAVHIRSYHTTSHHSVAYYSKYILLCRVVSWRVVSCHTIYCNILWYAISCYDLCYLDTLRHVIHATLWITMICYYYYYYY